MILKRQQLTRPGSVILDTMDNIPGHNREFREARKRMDLTSLEYLRKQIKTQMRYLDQIEQLRVCLNDSPQIMKDLENCRSYLRDLKEMARLLINKAEPDPALNRILTGYYVDFLTIKEIAQQVQMTQKKVKECLGKG